MMSIWIVHEWEEKVGYERQGSPDRLLTTTLFLTKTGAEKHVTLSQRPGIRFDIRDQFVNP